MANLEQIAQESINEYKDINESFPDYSSASINLYLSTKHSEKKYLAAPMIFVLGSFGLYALGKLGAELYVLGQEIAEKPTYASICLATVSLCILGISQTCNKYQKARHKEELFTSKYNKEMRLRGLDYFEISEEANHLSLSILAQNNNFHNNKV
jgi:hypothetical protein